MQRVCACPGGIKRYTESPGCLLEDDEERRRCPWCPSGHRLRLHGWYLRYAIEPAIEARRIAVRRLLCAVEGRTVSLLPDFCLPRRQHGPAVLGLFLVAFSRGAGLIEALRCARPDVPSHSVAQALLGGFLRREGEVKAYLAGVRHRVIAPPSGIPPPRRALAALVFALLEGFSEVDTAFRHHARRFHGRFGIALA